MYFTQSRILGAYMKSGSESARHFILCLSSVEEWFIAERVILAIDD